MKMPKKLKARWLEALRSGKYKQGIEEMYDPKTKAFCCLGVLEHVALGGKVEVIPFTDRRKTPCYCATPSKEFRERFGCEFDITSLVEMNDGVFTKQRNFEQIADWIDKNIEGT